MFIKSMWIHLASSPGGGHEIKSFTTCWNDEAHLILCERMYEWKLMAVSTANRKIWDLLGNIQIQNCEDEEKIRKSSIYYIIMQFQTTDLLQFSYHKR